MGCIKTRDRLDLKWGQSNHHNSTLFYYFDKYSLSSFLFQLLDKVLDTNKQNKKKMSTEGFWESCFLLLPFLKLIN